MEIPEIQSYIEKWLEIRPLAKRVLEIRVSNTEEFSEEGAVIEVRSRQKEKDLNLLGKLEISLEVLNPDNLDKKLVQIVQDVIVFPCNFVPIWEAGHWI